MKGEYDSILKCFGEAKRIAVVGHIKPDGDCVGSALALRSAFNGAGKTVDVFFDGDLPIQFLYLEGCNEIRNTFPDKDKYDLLVILDLSQKNRMGIFEPLMKSSKCIVCFDHHIGNEFGKEVVKAVNKNYASCGEIIYEFLVHSKIKITKQIADSLYTAIATDTGCFLYPSTTGRTHKIAGELIDAGVSLENINYINFRVNSRLFTQSLKKILKSLKFYFSGKFAIARTPDIEEKHKFKQLISDMEGVMVSAFLTREDDKTGFRVSLRSHGDHNVEPVARHFGGGGHKNASGCLIKGSYGKAKKQIAEQVWELCFNK